MQQCISGVGQLGYLFESNELLSVNTEPYQPHPPTHTHTNTHTHTLCHFNPYGAIFLSGL